MYLFLGWRELGDRMGTLGSKVENFLWGDNRSRHTLLIASTDEYPLLLIEIDVGDPSKGIQKSMKLNIVELQSVPKFLTKVEYIGEVSSPNALKNLIRAAQYYVKEHPNYNALTNNCRTFVEYVIDQVPEFRRTIPRKHGSILEYYHEQAKTYNPGVVAEGIQFLGKVFDFHQANKEYKCAHLLVLKLEIPQLDNTNPMRDIYTRL